MVRVPFLGGLIQHVVEDSWRSGICFSLRLLNILKISLKHSLSFYIVSLTSLFKRKCLLVIALSVWCIWWRISNHEHGLVFISFYAVLNLLKINSRVIRHVFWLVSTFYLVNNSCVIFGIFMRNAIRDF